jgi:hypothetical protein
LFKKRQKSFLSSLEHAMAAAGNDEYIRQMFEHKQSVAFVPDRVCEIILEILKNKREQFMQQLIQRIGAYEACFGADRAHELEDIGTRLLDLASAQQERCPMCLRTAQRKWPSKLSRAFKKLTAYFEPPRQNGPQMRSAVVSCTGHNSPLSPSVTCDLCVQ